MSEENVEIVRELAEAFNRRDLDALMTFLDEAVEHRDARRSSSLRGRGALRKHFVELWEDAPQASLTLDETFASRDWVVVGQLWRGLPDGDITTWVARQLLDARIRRIEVCATRAEALEAAGITE